MIKNQVLKNFALMTFPALLLAGFASYRPKVSPTLKFSNALIISSSQQQIIKKIARNRRNSWSDCIADTNLVIDVYDKKMSFPSNYWKRHTVREKRGSAYLSNSFGKKYTLLADATGAKCSFLSEHGDSSRVGVRIRMQRPEYGQSFSFLYKIHLASLPASEGRITFNAIYIAEDGFELPVSTIVRK